METPSFIETVSTNKSILVFKFGAKWCKPCQTLDLKQIFAGYNMVNVIVHEINIEKSFGLFCHLRQKKLMVGIPSFLVYKDSRDYLKPDGEAEGADVVKLREFFDKQFY